LKNQPETKLLTSFLISNTGTEFIVCQANIELILEVEEKTLLSDKVIARWHHHQRSYLDNKKKEGKNITVN
jgi:hypothetical protein